MRRFTAYSFDLMVFSFILFLFWFIFQGVTQLYIDNKLFYLMFFPIIISAFEYFYDGKTPGKFITRIKVVSLSSDRVSLATYYKRNILITYFLPVMFLLLTVVYDIFLNISLYNLTPYYSFTIFLALIIVPFIATFGAQSYHDCLFGTAVISDSKIKTRKFSRKYLYILSTIIIVMVTGVVYYIDTNKKRVSDIAIERGYLDEISRGEIEISDINLDTNILERNVEDLFDYYDDLHGYIGLQELGELDREIGIQTPPIFTFTLKEPFYVPVFRVFVTTSGLLNNRFRDTVTRNILDHSLSKTGSTICVVEFVHQDNYVGLFYLSVKQIRVGVHTGYIEGGEYNNSMVITPKHSGYLKFSSEKIPFWAIE